MVEKILHGVNVGACCAQLVTQAVDIASTGGVATAVGATLSAIALKPSARGDIEQDCLTALNSHLTSAALPPNIEQQIVLMLDSFLPGRTDYASGGMKAPKVAAHMRARVLTESNVPEYRENDVLDAYEVLLSATLTPLLSPRTQSEANQAEVLQTTHSIHALLSNNINDNDNFRKAEARLTMQRHQLEVSMEDVETGYTELISFLIHLSEHDLSMTDAMQLLKDLRG